MRFFEWEGVSQDLPVSYLRRFASLAQRLKRGELKTLAFEGAQTEGGHGHNSFAALRAFSVIRTQKLLNTFYWVNKAGDSKWIHCKSRAEIFL